MQKIVFIILVLLLGGCLSNRRGDPIINIAVDFEVDLWEDLGHQRHLSILFETTKIYDCENYTILSNVSIINRQIILTLEDIEPPSDSDCIPNATPAFKKIDVPLDSVGEYHILIELKSTIENAGFIYMEEDYYQLNLFKTDGLDIIHDELRRVPASRVWGYIAYNGEEQNNEIVDVFESDLAQYTSPTMLVSGYYAHFLMDETEKIEFEVAHNYDNIKKFIYKRESDKILIRDLLMRYREDYGEAIELKLYTSEGEEF